MHPEDGRVVSNFIMQALKGAPITLYGDGQQTRSFCYVDDLVEGLLRLMRCEQATEPVNLGNPVEMSISELARRIIDMTGSKSIIEYRPLPSDDPKQRCPDITRAKVLLQWQPKVQLDDGLMRTIAYFEDLLSRDASTVHQLSRRGAR
jgi:UDP-glucuronate decarboxylase